MPDVPRQQLEDELDTLSFEFRDYPTLPSDPLSEGIAALKGSLDENKGLLLPPKHCAFRYCTWCGCDDDSLVTHILKEHKDRLEKAMDYFAFLRPVVPPDEKALAMSVYNEGLAIAIRRGAPLASYSIDRRCLL